MKACIRTIPVTNIEIGGSSGNRSASLFIGISVPPTEDVVTVTIVFPVLLMCVESPL